MVTNFLAALSNQHHVWIEEAPALMMLDGLRVVAECHILTIAEKMFGDVVDVTRHDGAPNDNVLVLDLLCVDGRQHVAELGCVILT